MTPGADAWPALPLDAWQDTHATLHLWLQIVGKVRLAQTPYLNHCWHVTLYVTPDGLTTGSIPHGERSFRIDLDFVRRRLEVRTSDGDLAELPLEPQSVATFYAALMRLLANVGVPVSIHPVPNEIPEAIPFADDDMHRAYDGEFVQRYGRILVHAARVFTRFRANFIGKCSPVHFFWGAPDLAVSRFSGRTAPPHPGGVPNLPDRVTREAYSHEVSSCGFWAGGGAVPYPAFYSYAYPAPPGFADAEIAPAGSFYSKEYGEFILPYDVVRTSPAPDATLLAFLQSTYAAAADLGRWDRAALERPPEFVRPDGISARPATLSR
jgi:hypothetical protein